MKYLQRYELGELPGNAPRAVRVRLSMLAFIALAALILGVISFGDRSTLLDQADYVTYFREASWSWFVALWDHSANLFVFAVKMTTEEIGWRLWVVTLASMGFSPEAGVRITAIALNLLMIFALSKTRWPFFSLLLWAVLPYGLAILGLFQIRQGFALAIAMYFALNRRQPVRGALIASIVHTTYSIPALFLVLTHFVGKAKAMKGVSVVTMAAVGMSLVSAVLFTLYGGRRLKAYDQVEAYTLFSLIGLVIYLLVPAMVLWTRKFRTALDDAARDEVTRQLATMHIGLLVFLIVSYFVYPFAISRIGYYGTLMIPFLLPEVRLKSRAVFYLSTIVIMVMVYAVVKNYLDGNYSYFIG
ncbi:EpsG family protein [Caballeronia sp. BR00000012568055]|uniref:EpsG family protein n=1 Tax=Caballeronia sp. BR00000012568055 TaxID=2918761 RepID=UPI0023F67268|nr:EpsG family protein [Caballeronia sp. BR00000012568055]